MTGKRGILLWGRTSTKTNTEKHTINNEAYQDGSKSVENKVDFAVELMVSTRRKFLSNVATIPETKMTPIKTYLKKINDGDGKQWVIYRLPELLYIL